MPGLDLSKFTKVPPKKEEPQIDWGKYGAMFVRGLSGLAPGGLLGAAAGGAGELAAQTLEGREHYNLPEVGVQVGLGAIPFHGAASLLKAGAKGGLLSASGTAASQQAEEGLHIPTAEDAKGILLSGGIGSLGGMVTHGLTNRVKMEVKETPKIIQDKKVNDIVAEVKETPKIVKIPEIKIETPKIDLSNHILEGPKPIYLPKELQGAKPRFNIGTDSYSPVFENDLDKALFILAQKNPSKQDAKYLEFVIKHTGMSEEDIRKAALGVREGLKNKIKEHIKGGGLGGDLQIPKLNTLTLKVPEKTASLHLPTGKVDIITGKPKTEIPTEIPSVTVPTNPTIPPIKPPDEAPTVSSSFIPKKDDNSIDVVAALNVPKSTAASADLSAPLRQGLFLIGRKEWWNAWKPMIQSLNEGKYNEIQQSIMAHPKFKDAQNAGIAFSDVGSSAEEQFASKLAKSIPVFGKYIVKPSEQAYTVFLNKLRMDMYANLTDKAGKLGIVVPKENLANYINSATGRGSAGITIGGSSETVERAMKAANAVFFSPRFIASRVQLLNPVSYVKLDPFTRREALRDLATLSGVASTTLGLAHLAGADVKIDPTSTDFGKIRIGNTHIDTLGGFGQFIRLFAQTGRHLATDEKGPDVKRFVESKLSPAATMVKEMMSGKDYNQEKITIPESVIKGFAPMFVQDVVNLWKDDPNLVPLAGLSLFGMPSSTYGDRKVGSSTGIPKIVLPKVRLPK